MRSAISSHTSDGRGVEEIGIQEGIVLGILNHLRALSKEARDDLLRLARKYFRTDDEGKAEIRQAILEIVENAPAEEADWSIPPPGMSQAQLAHGQSEIEKRRADVAAWLKRERDQRGWTQRELAERAGLYQSHISRIEAGRHLPQEATRDKLAKALASP